MRALLAGLLLGGLASSSGRVQPTPATSPPAEPPLTGEAEDSHPAALALHAACVLGHCANASATPSAPAPPWRYDVLRVASFLTRFVGVARASAVVSGASVVAEANITLPEPPEGAPRLLPGGDVVRPVVQAAAGFQQVFGIGASVVAFSPEWLQAIAAFVDAETQQEVDEAAEDLAEEEAAEEVGTRRRLLQANLDAEAERATDDDNYVEPLEGLNATELLEWFDGVLDLPEGSSPLARATAPLSVGDLLRLKRSGFWDAFARNLPEEMQAAFAVALERAITGGSPLIEKAAEDLEDIIEQLSDVRPLLDVQIITVSRALFRTLGPKVSAGPVRLSAGVRLGPSQVSPFAFVLPAGVVATDLVREEAAAYVQSLQEQGRTTQEIKDAVLSALNIEAAVTLLLSFREQVSVNGGDIARDVFAGII